MSPPNDQPSGSTPTRTKSRNPLSRTQQDAASYCADNRPKLRPRVDVPDNPYLLALWDDQPDIRPGLRQFPPYASHRRACKRLQRNPFPPFKLGTPQDIEDKLTKATRSRAIIATLDDLYHHLGYDPERNAWVCWTRNKLIAKRIGRNEKTAKRATRYLLKGHWIERPRTGVPHPQHPSGYQSLYVLPFNYAHILWWRSQPNKSRKK